MSTQSLDWDSDPASGLEYKHLPWGELIYGTKDQIQRFGIAVGMAFPEELGGPKRQFTVPDPRGLSAEIERAYDGERYVVSISFPGRQCPRKQATDFAPGVRRSPEPTSCEEYIGTAEGLVAAGLVRAEHLPGAPGMRKVKVTILSDGSITSGPPTAALYGRGRESGAKTIERASKISYRVRVWLPEAERERRRESEKRADSEYQAKINALPRPAPLRYSARQHTKVVSLQEVRFARLLEARKPVNNADDILTDSNGERRRLLWVSLRESNLLSTIYEGRLDDAIALLNQMTKR